MRSQVILTNPTAESVDFRVIFQIAAPKKITGPAPSTGLHWVAVKELKLSYHVIYYISIL